MLNMWEMENMIEISQYFMSEKKYALRVLLQ